MTHAHNILVRWFVWFGWHPDKLEAWLEMQAAHGWHLMKTDRLMNRFHFQRGVPKTVRFFVDFPKTADEEYHAIFSDMGWSLVESGLGWYVWQAEYTDRRPDAVNDPQPLIERNRRLLIVLIAALVVMLLQLPLQIGLKRATAAIWVSLAGKVLIAVYITLVIVLAAAIAFTFSQIRKLEQRKH